MSAAGPPKKPQTAAAGPAAEGGRRGPWALLALFLALALGGLRLLELGTWSLWIDEALTAADYRLLSAGDGSGNYNPYAYLLMGRLAEALGGTGDPFSLRLGSALAGMLSIPLTAWALAPLAGRRPAALAALLVALSSWHLYWSQTARFYTLALCLSLLGAGLFLRGLRRSSPAWVVAGLALAAAAAAAQLQGALLACGLACAPLLLASLKRPFPGSDRRTLRAIVAVGLLVTVAGAGWAWGSFSTYLERKPAASTVHLVLTTGYHMTPALLAAALLGAVCAWRRRAPGALLVLALLVPAVAGSLVLSCFAMLSAQYLFLLLPWVAFLAAWPICGGAEGAGESLAGPLRSRAIPVWTSGLLLLLLLTSGGLGCWGYFTTRGADRPPWRAAWNHVAEYSTGDELICGMEAPIGEYYLNPTYGELRRPRRVAWIDEYRPHVPDPWLRRGRGVWVVLNRERLTKWKPADREGFTSLLEDRGQLAARFPRELAGRDLSVEVWHLK